MLLFSGEELRSYKICLNKNNFEEHFLGLCEAGVKCCTKKRKLTMWHIGSTIGAAHFPMFQRNPHLQKFSMLPRPVIKSRPGEIGHTFMTYSWWLNELVRDISAFTINYVSSLQTDKRRYLLNILTKSMKLIPKELRVCNSFFTQMILVGEMDKEGSMPSHVDGDDYINVVLSIGENSIIGGETLYFNGYEKKNHGEVIHKVSFVHGRLQVGEFSKVYHGVNNWKGVRGTFNFSIKKKILDHFIEEGDVWYKQFQEAGFPRKKFIAVKK